MASCATLTIRPTPPFDFAAAAFSHGWVVLAPTTWDGERAIVGRVEELPSGKVVNLTITGNDDSQHPILTVDVAHAGPLPDGDRAQIERAVAHMFRIDEAFSDFYAHCAARGGRWATIGGGLGRLLRSPTVFEDVVKTIATTNTQWSGAKRMVRRLVDSLGAPFPGEPALRAFPGPGAIAAAPPEALTAAGFGYRAAYVHELARRVAAGKLDLESLLHSDLPTAELRRELLRLAYWFEMWLEDQSA